MGKLHKNIEELEFADIRKLLWKFFWPSFAGVIINSLYNIVDRIFIGQGVDAYALSGLTAVFPIMLIIMGFGMLIGIGAGVRVSINMGKKDIKRAEKVLGNAFILIIIISIFITVVGFSIKVPLLKLFGVEESTFKYANDYLNIILFGTIFNMLGFSLNNIIRSEGNAKIAMFSMLISAGTNIILDPIFIFGLDMGVKGAAWATIIAQFVLSIWVIRHFTSHHAVVRLKRFNFKLEGKIIWYIFTIGFAPFSMQLAASFEQGVLNTQLVKHGGDLAVGALGIIMSFMMLVFMTVIAINMSSQPIVGFNFGNKNHKRVKETLVTCLKASTYISFFGFLIAQLFPGAIVKLFNSDSQELFDLGVQGLRIFMAAWIFVGFQVVAGNYFQAVGKAGIASFISLLRQLIILIPALFILPNYLGLRGVWLSPPISDALSAIICCFFLIREFKQINEKIKLENMQVEKS